MNFKKGLIQLELTNESVADPKIGIQQSKVKNQQQSRMRSPSPQQLPRGAGILPVSLPSYSGAGIPACSSPPPSLPADLSAI